MARDGAYIKRQDGTLGRLNVSRNEQTNGTPEVVNDEISQATNLVAPHFSPSVPSETQNAFTSIVEKQNVENQKNWQARRDLARLDAMADDLTAIKVSQAESNATVNNTFALMSTVAQRMDGVVEKVEKLRITAVKTRRSVGEIQRENHALWQAWRKHDERLDASDERITAIEVAKRDAEQQEVGKQKLVTKGRAIAGVAFTIWTFVAAKLAALAGIFHK